MHPVLFKIEFPIIGPITIYTYGFMMAMAFLTCYYILRWELKRVGDNPDFASSIIFWGAIGGILGSKILYLLENFSDVVVDPIGMVFSGAGLVFHGGIIGGAIAIVAIMLKSKRKMGLYSDMIGPILFLGQGIGRIGCFFAGCCHGKSTDFILNIRFPEGSIASVYQYNNGMINSSFIPSLPVHPTQLYETVFNFIMFFILVSIRPKLRRSGLVFCLYMIFAGTERFFLEFIRVNPVWALGLTVAQFTSIAFVLAGTILIYFTVPKEKNK